MDDGCTWRHGGAVWQGAMVGGEGDGGAWVRAPNHSLVSGLG